MKKRRELDALVGGVKSRRKNSNSGHELLKYNGSDSSDDDFHLSSPKVRGSGLCSTCTSVFIFLLLVACMLVCAGLTWMHVEMKKDLELLRISLQTVESRSMASTDDVEKLYKQMAAVNKTLEQQSKSLKTTISDISAINRTVLQLSGRVDKLGEGLKAAPELRQLPEKLQTVSQTVATMGSDVKNMKDTVDKVSPFMKTTSESIDSLKQQFETVKNQVSASEVTPDRESMKPDLANVIQGLSNQLQTVNSSVSTQLSVLMKSNSQQEERIVKLEETSQMLMKNISSISTDHTSIASEHDLLTDDYTSEKFKSSVTDIVQDLLSDESPLPSNSNIEAVMANITQVLGTLKDMEEKYENLESQPGPVTDGDNEYVSMEMFKTLGDGFETKVENLNSSFISLKTDVTTMSQLLTKQSNTVTNLTHQVDATRLYLATLMQKLAGTSAAPEVSEGPGSTEKVTKTTTVKPGEFVTTKKEEENTTKGPGTSPVASTSQSEQGTIHVDFIKTPQELDTNFRRWDRAGTGQVNYDVLDGFLGPQTPKEEDLKPYDEDNNGLYSLAEFAKAFGISLATTTTTETVTEPTPPPR
ncbi:EF-hand calcium-binding domain-containing protein 14-like isoform X2 [Mercenaria mercenaria]|uniref:EF-hand calcium-binding domain-containing protein 14-like isoform X2 n=1 Tax=Mercenaria mercenaria TaxID=6596 RepID=UPI00234F868D|nr:EF-hand calcium-binding domain-containing protein 14-like isoform X2 [Mercenaria mercenaria]